MKRLVGWSLTAAAVAILIFFWLASDTRTTRADALVGTGTPASCTENELFNAITVGGKITFNCGGPATITFTFEKQIAVDTTIDGGGLITLSGQNTNFFQVFAGKSLTLLNITLANGSSSAGGAIENIGTTIIVNCQFVNNRSTGHAGAIANNGTLQIISSVFSNNQAVNAGGAIFNDGGSVTVAAGRFTGNKTTGSLGAGGAVNNFSGVLAIQGTIFDNNSAFDGGAISVATVATATVDTSTFTGNTATYGGAIESFGAMTVTSSTFTENQSTNDGGGLWNVNGQLTIKDTEVDGNKAGQGGGISSYQTLVLMNVTVSNNTSTGNGGGIFSTGNASLTNVTLSGNRATPNGGGGIFQSGNMASLDFVTVANNSANFGAGVFNQIGSMVLQNTMLANNTVGNCDGVLTSLGHNLSDDTHCSAFTNTDDHQHVSLPLGPLTNNGGPTLTRLPLPGNPAIDGGLCVTGITTDQRGGSRPVGPACDVGSVEVGALVPRIFVPALFKNAPL